MKWRRKRGGGDGRLKMRRETFEKNKEAEEEERTGVQKDQM